MASLQGVPTFEELCRPGGGLIAAKDTRAANNPGEIRRDVACALFIAQRPYNFDAQGKFIQSGSGGKSRRLDSIQSVFDKMSDHLGMQRKKIGGGSSKLRKMAEKIYANPSWCAVKLPDAANAANEDLAGLFEAFFPGARPFPAKVVLRTLD